MGNIQTNPFCEDFKGLIKALIESTNDDKLTLIKEFSSKWKIPLQGAERRFVKYKYSETPIVPLQDFEAEVVINIRLLLTESRFTAGRASLNDTLEIIQNAIPVIEDLYSSKKDNDKDLYYLVINNLMSSVLDNQSRIELSNSIKAIKSQKKEGKKNFYYKKTKDDKILKESIKAIRSILEKIKQSFDKYTILWPDYILNLPADTTSVNDAIHKNLNDNAQTIDHILKLIPQEFLIMKQNILPETDSLTLYSGTICLNEKFFKGYTESILQAQLVVTIMHELAHCKRIQYYSSGQCFFRTPEKFDQIQMNGGAGFYFEEKLFGRRIPIKRLDITAAKLILDPDNYSSNEKWNGFKAQLNSALENSNLSQANVARTLDDEECLRRCGFRALNFITAFKE